MSALTASMASIWSAVSRYGKAASNVHLHLAVGREGVAGPDLALGVEVDQLARHRAGGAPGARLQVLPALAAERAERGLVALRPDVAADPGELVGGREDAVAAAVLQLEVVAGDPGERLGVEAREAGDAVVLVDDVVADPQLDRGREPGAGRDRRRRRVRRWTRRRCGITANCSSGAKNPSRSRASAKLTPGSSGALLAEEGNVDAAQVEARALRLAAALEGDDGPVAGAGQLLQLALGLAQGARRELGPLRPEGVLLARRRRRARARLGPAAAPRRRRRGGARPPRGWTP